MAEALYLSLVDGRFGGSSSRLPASSSGSNLRSFALPQYEYFGHSYCSIACGIA